MPNTMEQKRLISHAILPESLENTIQKITERIKHQEDYGDEVNELFDETNFLSEDNNVISRVKLD